jgi:hypothetical protein
MDEREFEDRLSRRLHARFDSGVASPALRDRVAQTLRRNARPARPVRWRMPAAAAAVLVAFAVLALASRFAIAPAVGPSASAAPTATSTASPTAAPSATPSATPTMAGLAGTVPPLSTSIWTGLKVHALSGAPGSISNVITWMGGYIAIAAVEGPISSTAWFSRDGRSWIQLPTSTFGLDQVEMSVSAGAPCRDGVIVGTYTPAGATAADDHKLWYSSDGTTWVDPTIDVIPTMLAGNSSGAIAADETGLRFTSDCKTWQPITLPGPAGATVNTIAAFGSGFVAAGWSGEQPVAWWSADGQHWTQATVPSVTGESLVRIYAGSGGLVGLVNPDSVGGHSDLWTSPNGQSWSLASDNGDPLGLQSSGEGQGNPDGDFAGDGTRLEVFGNPTFAGTVPNQIWISTDGIHWKRLFIDGTGGTVAMTQMSAFLMRNGILFSGLNGTWFGDATP